MQIDPSHGAGRAAGFAHNERFSWRGMAALCVCMTLGLGGCATLASSVTASFAESLSQAILGHDDPETVRDGAPAYLLLMDSLVTRSPGDAATLESAAILYSAYGALFITDTRRAQRVSARAREYAEAALCARDRDVCLAGIADFEEFEKRLAAASKKELPALHAYATSLLIWIRARSDDWIALAQLPHAEAVLRRMNTLDPNYQAASVNTYLGVLNTLRPPALGGKPEEGRAHFERAIELSGGHDLGVKVEFAKNYARMLYERELHDRLLTEVVEAEPRADGYTLLNVLAQREAQELLDSADEYF